MEQVKNIIRDPNSSALVNKDASGLEEYKMRRRKLRQKDDRIENLEARIQRLEELLGANN